MWHKRINVAVIILTCLLVGSVLFPFIQHARQKAQRSQSKNNLKQIGLALFNYADVYQGLPPGGVFNREGRGYHGLMTSILPYIEGSPFYQSIDFNQPWDSTQNAGMFLQQRQSYENPSEPTLRRHWEFPVAHYSANSHIMAANSCVRLKSIESKERVFLVGELAGDFLPWGCPYNWRELHGLNSSPPTYGRSTRDGCQFLFGDGRVELVSNDVSRDVLKQMSGDDFTGFEANLLNIHRPSSFPCPSDALTVSWRFDHSPNEFVVVKRDTRARPQHVRSNNFKLR